jgi:hypothetical protein
MKLEAANIALESSLPDNGQVFRMEASAHMMQILSDRIYTDKIMAVIRELSCNANDSHIAAAQTPGWQARKFIVNVPTQLDPVFYVEDFGTGIPHDKIADIYWSYGKSTKTTDNTQTGALGLGSKSPFAYTKSSFVVRNRHDGVEITYFCALNEQGIPMGHEVGRVDTTVPNGVRVELAVKISDIEAFRKSMLNFFMYWNEDKLPIFRSDSRMLEQLSTRRGEHLITGDNWYIRNANSWNSGAIALMGNVPYRINAASQHNATDELRQLCSSNIVMNFEMGEVSFTPSREELEYDPRTMTALNNRAFVVVKNILDEMLKDVDYTTETPYELYKLLQGRRQQLERSFPMVVKTFTAHEFKLKDGRIFSLLKLMTISQGHEFKWPGRIPYGIYNINRVHIPRANGVQRKQFEPIINIELYHNSSWMCNIKWYPGTLKPVKQGAGVKRKRTTANLLAEGYVPKTSSYHFKFGNGFTFIVNDMGDEGELAFKMWDQYIDAYFVSGDADGKTHQETKDWLVAQFKSTIFEGLNKYVFLSQVPKFSVDPKLKELSPRAPIQRGTMPLRTFAYTGEAWAIVNDERVNYKEKFYFTELVNGRITSVDAMIDDLLTSKKRYNLPSSIFPIKVVGITPSEKKELEQRGAIMAPMQDIMGVIFKLITPDFLQSLQRIPDTVGNVTRLMKIMKEHNIEGPAFYEISSKLKHMQQHAEKYEKLEMLATTIWKTPVFANLPGAPARPITEPSTIPNFPNLIEIGTSMNPEVVINYIKICERAAGFNHELCE